MSTSLSLSPFNNPKELEKDAQSVVARLKVAARGFSISCLPAFPQLATV